MMDAGVTQLAKSILEKPLGQLTEEDISQLTREDCRRFLKEKGMRRPSWNKSQAIQQVISLKALYEPGDDSGAAVLRRILASPPENVPRAGVSEPQWSLELENERSLSIHAAVHKFVKSVSSESVEELEGSAQIPSPLEDISPCEHNNPRTSADLRGQFVAEKEENKIMPPRSPGEANESVGQMTFFYRGKVIVYDRVPPEKALAIMRFAASPINPTQNDLSRLQMETRKCDLGPHIDKMEEFPLEVGNNARDPDVEGQANRKVSLQRYLEKRKDRGRFVKGRKGQGAASSILEMYMNHQTRLSAASYGQSSRSSTTSPPNFDTSAVNQTRCAQPSRCLNPEDI